MREMKERGGMVGYQEWESINSSIGERFLTAIGFRIELLIPVKQIHPSLLISFLCFASKK